MSYFEVRTNGTPEQIAALNRHHRNAVIAECIRAVAGVMRVDPDSAGGPIFDALRALGQ